MKYHNIADLYNWPNGTHLEGVQGTLVKLWQPKTGNSEHGPWSLQGGEIKDQAGNSIEVTFKDQDPIPDSWKGQWLILTAAPGDKGTTGLVIDDFFNQKKNQNIRRIKITPSASIEFGDARQGGGPQPARQGQQRPQNAPQGQNRQQGGQARPGPQQGQGQQQRPQGGGWGGGGQQQPQQRPAANAQTSLVNGQTVGMAMNQACEFARLYMGHMSPTQQMAFMEGPGLSQLVYNVASDLLRLAPPLEKRKWAPAAKDRNGEAPAARQQPQQQRQPDPAPQPDQHSDERPLEDMDEIPF